MPSAYASIRDLEELDRNWKGGGRSATKRKVWNISTYKWHSLGDYPDSIVWVGTSDSYSTQTSEMTHKKAKLFYRRTNKHQFELQIAAHERRQRLLRAIKRRLDQQEASAPAPDESTAVPDVEPQPPAPAPPPVESELNSILQPEDDTLPLTPPHQHHHISDSKRTWLHLVMFLSKFRGDPALTFSLQDLADVTIQRERVYTHKILRVNYTTYDTQRDQDTLNTSTHPDFMVLAHEEEDNNPHPYWYGRILGIFHADVRHVGPRSKTGGRPQRMEFLWVRWFGRDIDHVAGWATKRLHRVGFVEADNGPFGFLDPAQVLRGAHIIPAFHHGRTTELLGPSIARHFDGENDEDYCYCYVNSFVDRDMFMRYSPDAVGHRSTRPPVSTPPIDPDAAEEEQWMDVDEDENDQSPVDPELDDGEPGSDSEEEEKKLDSGSEDSDAVEEDGEEDDVEENAAEGGADATDEGITEFLGYSEL
ncbi:hypothetical protein C8F04DRAFT_1260454 [Mycena alexandri]|uniref:Uncharacterized protein n=1 Tax=Mycena alexandri TaxID=1745969 RepID=A0AAD6SUE2_9AGAR|nr:hypothetical protein C8F04DRAFT_1260454 [Mycena alexandri]